MTGAAWDDPDIPAGKPPADDAPLLLTPNMIVPRAEPAPADAGTWLKASVRQVAEATEATLALLAATTHDAAAALPAQLLRGMQRRRAPRATAPRLRPVRGGVLALLLHAAVLGLLILRIQSRPLAAPPDAQVIALMMTAAAAPGTAPQPEKPVTPPAPAPALPKPAPVAKPAPPVPTVVKPAELPAPALVHAAIRKPAPARPPAPAATAASNAAAAPAAISAGPSTPARPDSSSTNATPQYPLASRQLREEGVVLLSVTVLPDGSVGNVSIEVSSGYPRLDDAARDALMRWRFHPALKNGVPVSSSIPYYFNFSLQ